MQAISGCGRVRIGIPGEGDVRRLGSVIQKTEQSKQESTKLYMEIALHYSIYSNRRARQGVPVVYPSSASRR